MTNSEFTAEVRATLRHDIAQARERAELVEALEGSVLWERLTAKLADRYDRRFEWQLESEDRHNDPRRGQAADINRFLTEP